MASSLSAVMGCTSCPPLTSLQCWITARRVTVALTSLSNSSGSLPL